MPDREQLSIAAVAFEMIRNDPTIGYRMIPDEAVEEVLCAVQRLSFSLTPAQSHAEAPRIASQAPEGSEATHTAERAVLNAADEWEAARSARDLKAIPANYDREYRAINQLGIVVRRWRAGVETEETPT